MFTLKVEKYLQNLEALHAKCLDHESCETASLNWRKTVKNSGKQRGVNDTAELDSAVPMTPRIFSAHANISAKLQLYAKWVRVTKNPRSKIL